MDESTNYTGTTASARPLTLSATSSDRHAAQRYSTDISIFAFALPEWLRLFLLAAMLDLLRQISSKTLDSVHQACWVTVSFEDEDACYTWVIYWLSKHPSWHEARSVQATTRTYGVPSHGATIPQQVERNSTAHTLTYMPGTKIKHTMWYKGYWTVVQRERVHGEYDIWRESLHISFFTRNNSVIDELLVEARQCYVKAQNRFVSVYVQDTAYSGRAWRQVSARPKRPLKSIILERGIKERLMHDACEFLASAEWYAKRGIPFRRGYLLYGAPGSGKTSVIQSMAGELGLDIYILTLNRAGLDDDTLSQLVAELPKRCIALIEDIDAAFHRGVSRRPSEEEGFGDNGGGSLAQGTQDKKGAAECRVSLSGLLNALDGIAAQEGRILFATTNHHAALDPALCRPGRMDLRIEFKLASQDQARRLFYHFYSESDDDDREPPYNIDTDPSISAKGDTLPSPPPSPIMTEGSSTSENHCSLPRQDEQDTQCELRQLAVRFAAAVPNERLSMASLQGYLMLYKDQPHDAVSNAASWVHQEGTMVETANNGSIKG